MLPTGVSQLFIHPENTALSFLCRRAGRRGTGAKE